MSTALLTMCAVLMGAVSPPAAIRVKGVLSTFGCTQMQTLEELERTAELTGDWSAVHERERVLARRASRKPPRCPPGLVSYCEKYAGSQRCTCINRNVMQSVFVRR